MGLVIYPIGSGGATSAILYPIFFFMCESSTQDTEEVKIPIPVFPSSDNSDDDDWVFYADL